MTDYRIRLEGPAALTLSLATTLANADGVELIASDQPVTVDDGTVELQVTVEGAFDAVAGAVATIRADMPTGASVEIVAG